LFISYGSGLSRSAGWYAEFSVLVGSLWRRVTALALTALSTLRYMWQRDGSSKEKKNEKEPTIVMPGGE